MTRTKPLNRDLLLHNSVAECRPLIQRGPSRVRALHAALYMSGGACPSQRAAPRNLQPATLQHRADEGVSRNWWDLAGIDMTGREMLTWGSSMRWILQLIEAGMPSGVAGVDIMEISRPDGASNIADLGLTLSEAKQLLARVQQAIVAAQAGDLATRRPECPSCNGRCHVNGRRSHLFATPFGKVTVQLPRFRCVSCGHIERCVTWPSHCRSTPELDRLRAHLSALMPFRVAADVLTHLLPADVGMSPETLRAHTLKIGEQLCDIPTAKPVAAAMSITVTTDSTFIRSCDRSRNSGCAWLP